MKEKEKDKVLLLSYYTNPDWISVSLEGYNEYKQLTKYFDIFLVTHIRNAPELKRCGVQDNKVLYIDMGFLDKLFTFFLEKLLNNDWGSQKLTAFLIPYYIIYEFVIWIKLKKEIKSGAFSLVHRLTPVSPVMPSPFAWLMSKQRTSFSIGPINGGLPWPQGYESASKEKEWIRFFRKIYRYLPFSSSTYHKSEAIIVGSSYNWLEALRITKNKDKLFFIHENGVPGNDIVQKRSYKQINPVKICFIGRLVPYKNCNIVIHSAASLLKHNKVELEIVGDGWDRQNLEKIAKDLGLEKKVTFHGMLPHAEAMNILEQSHIMAFPSIKEFGGGVVVEAMARGVVPIVVRYGGPSDLVEESYGVSLELKNEEETTAELKQILEKMVAEPDLIKKLGAAAILKVSETFTWEKKTKLIATVLQAVIDKKSTPVMMPSKKLLAQYKGS